MDESRKGGLQIVRRILLLIVLVGVLGAGVIWYLQSNQSSGLEYQIAFRDARGLDRGDHVVLAGVPIGKVVGVRPDGDGGGRVVVTVRIDGEHAGAIKGPGDTSARIVTEGWLFPSRHVEIVNRGDRAERMAAGATVEGLENWAEEQVFRGRESAVEVIDQASTGLESALAAAGRSLEDARSWAEGPEATGIKDRIEAVRADLEQFGVEAAGSSREKLSELMEKGRVLTEDLAEYGRNDLASDLEGSLLEVKERANRALEDGAPRVEETGAIIEATPTPVPTAGGT